MFQLVYISTAAWPMDNGDLNTIIEHSRKNNRELEVTGILLQIDHGFLQILEGPRDAVKALYAKIQLDLRHIGLRVLVQQNVEDRLFSDWSMGFEKLDSASPRTAQLYNLTQEAIDTAMPPQAAKDLARHLRDFYCQVTGPLAA